MNRTLLVAVCAIITLYCGVECGGGKGSDKGRREKSTFCACASDGTTTCEDPEEPEDDPIKCKDGLEISDLNAKCITCDGNLPEDCPSTINCNGQNGCNPDICTATDDETKTVFVTWKCTTPQS